MSDRIASDHPSVQTVRSTCTETATGVKLEVPGDDRDAFPTDEVVRLVLDGATRHARFEAFAGSVRATGAYDAPDLARSPGDGTNRLRAWVEDRDLATGRTVHLDEIEPGFAYGLRAPGETAVYDAPGKPDDSLAAIARDLDREE